MKRKGGILGGSWLPWQIYEGQSDVSYAQKREWILNSESHEEYAWIRKPYKSAATVPLLFTDGPSKRFHFAHACLQRRLWRYTLLRPAYKYFSVCQVLVFAGRVAVSLPLGFGSSSSLLFLENLLTCTERKSNHLLTSWVVRLWGQPTYSDRDSQGSYCLLPFFLFVGS